MPRSTGRAGAACHDPRAPSKKCDFCSVLAASGGGAHPCAHGGTRKVIRASGRVNREGNSLGQMHQLPRELGSADVLATACVLPRPQRREVASSLRFRQRAQWCERTGCEWKLRCEL